MKLKRNGCPDLFVSVAVMIFSLLLPLKAMAVAAPSNLTVMALSTAQVNVGWSAVTGATYTVERSLNGTSGWTQIASTSATNVVDGGLTSATKYYYHVMATVSGVSSSWSSPVQTYTWHPISTGPLNPVAPPPSSIYTPNAALTSATHPRFLFSGVSLTTVQARASDSHYTYYYNDLISQANTDAGRASNPANYAGSFGDYLQTLTLAYLIDSNTTDKATYATAISQMVDYIDGYTIISSSDDLMHESYIMGLACVYDWLYNIDNGSSPILTSTQQTNLRTQMIALTRLLHSNTTKAYKWTNAHQEGHLNNHTWHLYDAQAIASVVLWGENTGISNEQKSWLDDSMTNFWYVYTSLLTDGTSYEGDLYQGVGFASYADFADIANNLTTCTVPFIANPAIVQASNRLISLTPNTYGFLNHGDTGAFEGPSFDAWAFRFFAHTLNDPNAQLCANEMETNLGPGRDTGDWHDMFWFDPTVTAPSTVANLPLSIDRNDLGLYTLRSSWATTTDALSFQCGASAGLSNANTWGSTIVDSHEHANQGTFEFYKGSDALVVSDGYINMRNTTDSNVVVFDELTPNPRNLVGQLGEWQNLNNTGIGWFEYTSNTSDPNFNNSYFNVQGKGASVISVDHQAGYTSYLCDLSNAYRLLDNFGVQYSPHYERRVTYLPGGAVVIVDNITSPHATNMHFRLNTYSHLNGPPVTYPALQWVNNNITFTSGSTTATITDFSPAVWSHQVSTTTPSFHNQPSSNGYAEYPTRQVADIVANNQTAAVFAAALRIGGVEPNLQVTASSTSVTIKNSAGTSFMFGW